MKSSSRVDQLYDPRICTLLEKTDEEWDQNGKSLKDAIYYGLNVADQLLYGIQFRTGELIGVQGAAKQRKTTLMANVILAVAQQFRQKELGWWIAVDTLESGIPPSGYRDMLIAILATWKMLRKEVSKDRREWPKSKTIRLSNAVLGEEMHIAKRWLQYARRTKLQYACIEEAKKDLATLPIMLFGPSASEGAARDLILTESRWETLYHGDWPGAKGCPVRLFIADNLQQFNIDQTGDYAKMNRVVDATSHFIASHKGCVGFMASQLSMSSRRAEHDGFGKAHSRGGSRFEEECNVLFRTRCDADKSPWVIEIRTDVTRDAHIPKLMQEIDFKSGAFLRPAVPKENYHE